MIFRIKVVPSLTLALLLSFAAVKAHAQTESRPLTDPVDEARRAGFAASLLTEGKKVTPHNVTIRGQKIEYSAVVSGTLLKDKEEQPSAIFVSMSYLRKGVSDINRRPVLFAWNGGPSGPSSGVHFGVLGPRIRASDDQGRPVEPARLVDNPDSILDRADLVLVDPAGTGLSIAVGKYKLQDFYSIKSDAESVAQFIRRWLEENGRNQSPVYLLGESYGTVRLPVTANLLQTGGIRLAGLVFIASAMDGNTIWEASGHLEPYFFYLPSYAAIAAYHKRLPQPRSDVRALYKEVSDFALGEYLTALFSWPNVTPALKAEVLDKLYRYTGISREVWEKNQIRLGTMEFSREILKEQGLVTGFSDARQTFPAQRPAAKSAPGGVPAAAVQESFINAYLRTELGIAGAPAYREMAPGSNGWNWFDHGLRTRVPLIPGYQNLLDDLALAMKNNPRLRVMQNSGIYDEQCNAFPADWALERMNIAAELRGNIRMYDYESGHAVFANSPTEFANFTKNLAAFLNAADSDKPAAAK
jgi:carboxypeptidase C (cathepsin A)